MALLIPTVLGSHIGEFYDRPYWTVKLRDGINGKGERWICEMDINTSLMFNPNHRYYDWTLDLVTTGDVLKIAELWMFCPRNKTSPHGNTAVLRFKPEETGTAFMFNVSQQNIEQRIDHKIIGKVTDRYNGDCMCFIWDDELRVMSSPWHTNIYQFGTWRPGVPGKTGGIAPIPTLNHEVIGLRL